MLVFYPPGWYNPGKGGNTMEKKALLVVSFGTCAPEALERDLVPVEEAVSAALPEYADFLGTLISKTEA